MRPANPVKSKRVCPRPSANGAPPSSLADDRAKDRKVEQKITLYKILLIIMNIVLYIYILLLYIYICYNIYIYICYNIYIYMCVCFCSPIFFGGFYTCIFCVGPSEILIPRTWHSNWWENFDRKAMFFSPAKSTGCPVSFKKS